MSETKPADTAARLSVADAFTLPPAQAKLVDDLIGSEQWLARIGAREIITALLDADSQSMANGARRLRAAFETAFTEGYEQGRETSFAALCAWALGGAFSASVFWALAWWLTR